MPVPSHGSEVDSTVRSTYNEHPFSTLSDDTLAERRALLYTVFDDETVVHRTSLIGREPRTGSH